MITKTEFQKRGWPHWHMLIFLRLPWDINTLCPDSPYLNELLEFWDHHISTDHTQTTYHHVQTHSHVPERCFSKKRKSICKYGFPKFPFSK